MKLPRNKVLPNLQRNRQRELDRIEYGTIINKENFNWIFQVIFFNGILSYQEIFV